jgi:hypothetical protein
MAARREAGKAPSSVLEKEARKEAAEVEEEESA